jgi:hypothetical protein
VAGLAAKALRGDKGALKELLERVADVAESARERVASAMEALRVLDSLLAEGCEKLPETKAHIRVAGARLHAASEALLEVAAAIEAALALSELAARENVSAQPSQGGWWRVSGSKLFNSELLEKMFKMSLKDPRAFDDLEDIFQALRDPDFDTGYSYELGVAFSGCVRAALRGEADRVVRWVRRERVLERALVWLFKDFIETGFKGHVYGLRRYLDRVAAAFEALSRLAAREDLKRLYSDLAVLTDRLAAFAYALDTDSYVETLNTAVERGLAHPLALHVELLRLEDDQLRARFYEAWKKRRIGFALRGWQVELQTDVGELACGGGGDG